MLYHHRGACLQALAMGGHTGLSPSSVHLWTLPLFHCNGWCFPWAVMAAAATHVCLPKVDPGVVWRLIREEGVTHLNGALTVLSMLRPEWNALDAPAQARLKARQGVGNMIACVVRVIGDDGADVPADGTTIGEIALRGNNVMLGYFKDPEATRAAAPDGWFGTGDLGALHPDGYVELRDRSKDVIISGGENIASVGVEQAIALG